MADDKSVVLRPMIDHYKHGIVNLGKHAHELVSHEKKVSASHVKFAKGLGEVRCLSLYRNAEKRV